MGKLPFEEIKRKILVKKEGTTDEKYGAEPGKRDIGTLINYGVVNINKPAGPTSHQVSAYVKNIFGIKQAGHGGTLE